MFVRIITPNGIQLETNARLVSLYGTHGVFEILENHEPMIAEVCDGPLKIITLPREYHGDTEETIEYNNGIGFVRVENNECIITVKSLSIKTNHALVVLKGDDL